MIRANVLLKTIQVYVRVSVVFLSCSQRPLNITCACIPSWDKLSISWFDHKLKKQAICKPNTMHKFPVTTQSLLSALKLWGQQHNHFFFLFCVWSGDERYIIETQETLGKNVLLNYLNWNEMQIVWLPEVPSCLLSPLPDNAAWMSRGLRHAIKRFICT